MRVNIAISFHSLQATKSDECKSINEKAKNKEVDYSIFCN